MRLTDYITITVFVLNIAEWLQGGFLQDGGIFEWIRVSCGYRETNGGSSHIERS
jgi:hypothetical protein